MTGPEAVLFDWRGVLVADPPDAVWVRAALARTGRDVDECARWCDAIARAGRDPEVVAGAASCDCSAEQHRTWSLDFFARAGLDDDLATALYSLDFEVEFHPFFPDVLPTFSALHQRGVKIAVVSDIHVDLRPEFVAAGLDPFVDVYVLSFEHGVQKPDPRMFQLALDALGVDAADAIMVGDRPSHDGGAVLVGIQTWLLPTRATAEQPRGLSRLLHLVG